MAHQLFTQEAGTMVTVPPAIGTHKMESTNFQCRVVHPTGRNISVRTELLESGKYRTKLPASEEWESILKLNGGSKKKKKKKGCIKFNSHNKLPSLLTWTNSVFQVSSFSCYSAHHVKGQLDILTWSLGLLFLGCIFCPSNYWHSVGVSSWCLQMVNLRSINRLSEIS